MATARAIVEGALRLSGIRPAESPIEANEAQDGLESLNDMLAEWDLEGIHLGFEPVEDLDDELYVPRGTEGGIKANLAIYINPEYERALNPTLMTRAITGKRIARALRFLEPLQYPDSLPVGSGNEHTAHSSDGDGPNNNSNRRFYPPNVRRRCS